MSSRPPASIALRLARQAWRVQYQDSEQSHGLAEQALARALKWGDVNAEGWARLALGNHLMRYASAADAVPELESAARCFEQSADRRGALMAAAGIARCLWRQGQVRECLSQVMALRNEAMQVLDAEERSMLLNVIAGGYSARGDSSEAFAYLYQALRELRGRRVQGFDVVLFCNLAHELLQLGDYYEALNYVDEGIERCRRMANSHLLAVLVLNRVICLTDLDLAAEAMTEVRRLAELMDAGSGHSNSVEAYASMAIAALRAGDTPYATELVERAGAACNDATVPEDRLVLVIARAELLRANGRLNAALAVLSGAEPLPVEGLMLRLRCLYFQTRAAVYEECGAPESALADLRRWQSLHQDRALMASKGRYQAASLQTELLRLQQQRDELDAQRRASERAKADLEAINGQLSQKSTRSSRCRLRCANRRCATSSPDSSIAAI
jgi:tetratricopeptide (TPR) repeat protein